MNSSASSWGVSACAAHCAGTMPPCIPPPRRPPWPAGISQQTLSRWLQEARNVPDVSMKKRTAKTWTVDEKVRVLGEAATMTGAQLTGLLEREGLLLAELEQWRLALGDEASASLATTKRIRQLERELARKEKALAEAAALFIPKKKVGHLWEDEDDDTNERKGS